MTTWLKPTWPAPKNVNCMITTKLFSPKLPVRDFKLALMESLTLPSEPIWLNQIHSGDVVTATETNRNQAADASIATLKKNICIVFTADCLPILACNQQGNIVSAMHAGWRGLLYDIIPNTIQRMPDEPKHFMFYFGPAIGKDKFEVGRDVYDAFLHKDNNNDKAFVKKNQEKWLLDIYALARLQLNAIGIDDKQIFGGMHCTFSEEDLFYSYRRDHQQTGRMASLIWFD